MIVEVFENLGESSDLYPYGDTYGTVDVTTDGAIRILRWLNRAYRKVCNTQLPDGTFIRFRALERHTFFRQTVVASTVASVPATNQISVTGLVPIANKYMNWIVDLGAVDADSQGTEQHLVISNDVSNPPILTLADDILVAPTPGDATNVYKKFWPCSRNTGANYHIDEFIPIDPKEDFLSALWLYDIQSMRDIKRYEEKAPLRKNVLTQLFPGMFWDAETPGGGWYAAGIGGGIEFDVAPTNGLVFELHYYAQSEQLTAADQVILVPDQFSEMIVKWATKTGLIRDREWDAQYAIRKEFEADMATAIQDGALRFEYDLPYLWIDK
jgi:hypothetical protein